jgi:hypothetical protein
MQAKQPITAQKQPQNANRGRFERGNKHAFKPGQSGNPGGLPKGTPKVKVALMNILGLEPEKFKSFKAETVAEELAFKQVSRALGLIDTPVKDAINATEKIADHTEGKATEHKEITGKDGAPLNNDVELELRKYDRMIKSLMGKWPGLTREQAIANIAEAEAVKTGESKIYKYVQE